MVLESKKRFPYELELNARFITSAALVTNATGVLAKLNNLGGKVYLDAPQVNKNLQDGEFCKRFNRETP